MSELSKLILFLALLAVSPLSAQTIGAGALLNGSISSSFTSPIAEPPGSSSFSYVIDNNLTNGVASVLTPIPFTATAGASAFSWGTASSKNTESLSGKTLKRL